MAFLLHDGPLGGIGCCGQRHVWLVKARGPPFLTHYPAISQTECDRLDWSGLFVPRCTNSSREIRASRCLAAFAALACLRRERSPHGTFTFEDIIGIPWIEIDFAADIDRARNEILPRIPALEETRLTDPPEIDRGAA